MINKHYMLVAKGDLGERDIREPLMLGIGDRVVSCPRESVMEIEGFSRGSIF